MGGNRCFDLSANLALISGRAGVHFCFYSVQAESRRKFLLNNDKYKVILHFSNKVKLQKLRN